MARKRKVDQEAGPSRRKGRGSSDQQAAAEPADPDDAAADANEDVFVEVEDDDIQGGNQRREEWAALARRCIAAPSSDVVPAIISALSVLVLVTLMPSSRASVATKVLVLQESGPLCTFRGRR